MELGITQIELTSIRDNDSDSLGNKIKLKGTSLKNFTSHIKNVPYYVVKGPNIKTEDVNLSENKKSYKLLPNTYDKLVFESQKPINVKENMLNNIKSKYAAIAISDIKVSSEIVADVSNVDIDPSIVVNDVNNYHEEIVQQNFNLSEFDNIKNEVLIIKQKAVTAQQEADNSETELQQVVAQYNEIEKQLQEAKEKNELIRQKRTDAINNQGKILASIKEKHKVLIKEANARRESNQNKIIEFKTKIDATNEQILSINDDTARQQEIINALYSFEDSSNINNFSNTTNIDEEVRRKIA